MRPFTPPRPLRSRRLLLAAALLAAIAVMPLAATAASPDVHEARAERRITELHKTLLIEASQEPHWLEVAKVMRANATTMDQLTQARSDRAGDLTALDDLKTYGEISEAHATGVKNLTAAFTPLYAEMSDAQKKRADAFFRKGSQRHHKARAANHDAIAK